MYYLKQIHIQNFRNIEYQTIQFWKNKTVFVWKNGSWKTVILKAIDKLLNAKKIKEKDFRRKEKKNYFRSNSFLQWTRFKDQNRIIFRR